MIAAAPRAPWSAPTPSAPVAIASAWCPVAGRRPGAVHPPTHSTPSATSTATTRAWALDRLHHPLTLSELAGHAGMSVRTFTRRFRDEVGTTPGQWLTAQRIQHARHLLETSDLPIDQVASRAGFATASSLRHHFRAAIGISPSTYRRTFRPAKTPIHNI